MPPDTAKPRYYPNENVPAGGFNPVKIIPGPHLPKNRKPKPIPPF
jgi:hypothetical protein